MAKKLGYKDSYLGPPGLQTRFVAHGIGLELNELPFIAQGHSYPLEEGMTFTIEPMVNAGKRHVSLLPDDWTVVTKDHSLSAQWEHTVAVTSTGCEILTLRGEEKIT